MNIENDIEKFKKLGYETIYKELKELEEEIRIKKYFFTVANIIEQLDKFIKNDIFKDAGIKSLKLKQSYDIDIGEVFSFIEILDNKNQSIHIYNDKGNYIAEYELINELLGYNNFLLQDNLYNDAIDKKTLQIELNIDTKNVLKNYLFNDNLLKAYNYMVLLDKNPPKSNKEKIMNRKI